MSSLDLSRFREAVPGEADEPGDTTEPEAVPGDADAPGEADEGTDTAEPDEGTDTTEPS